MKREAITHFTFLIAFLVFVALIRNWVNIIYLPLLIGGIIGTLLPDLDHVIYVYLSKPDELTSQRTVSLVSKGEVIRAFNLLYSTRNERTKLVFHTVLFQVVFIVFTFFVLSSTTSLVARGITLAFLLHLLVDQLMDFADLKDIQNWFADLQISLDRDQRKWYVVGQGIVLLIFGFLM